MKGNHQVPLRPKYGQVLLTINVAGVAEKIIKCLEEKNIQVCKAKPNMGKVKSCADSSVESANKIPQNVLVEVFAKLYQERVQTPRFQVKLINLMTEHLKQKSTLESLTTNHMKEIVLASMHIDIFKDSEYIEVYCSFKEVIHFAYKCLEWAQNCYNELESLAEKNVQTDSEIIGIMVNARQAQMKILTDILKSYDSFEFVFKPWLRFFISELFVERSNEYEHDKLHKGISDEIENILKQIDIFENDPDASQKGIPF
ncbi:hypothetical protein RF11_03935 [Thelohanellus kitauei]|uniref:Uncharacterized protein n=1 Tax=Thelohanellus kitauei TaxID=669202 RepID=A0A0C2N771_THEKT|nr:hypothetical protein RF11_03935 [Thelohanellus kitauei]